ncbi:MAG: major facilitator superfamily 1 [Phenylobacterium sp.]|nr:major facilitator superfamily 1 [Phenylobacterium sp.]
MTPTATAAGVLADRRGAWAFWIGCAAVTAGVLAHLPMVWMGRHAGFRLAGMPMDPLMIGGMGLIVAGVAVAGFGLLPRRSLEARAQAAAVHVTPPEDAPLTSAHWRLMALLVVALVIDVMKPASLGFVVPGMVAEYGVSRATVAILPFSALAGTACGSIVWGVLADIFGRRASILLSAVMFVGTSICGAMPSLWWNVAMCFLMGAAAGGMLPVAYALLAESMPSRHRGWSLVLIGGLGAVGGYLAASGLSALLQPTFGWRIMWFLGMPTGLILIVLNGAIPESAKFLLSLGRVEEAHAVLRRFGSRIVEGPDADAVEADAGLVGQLAPTPLAQAAFLGKAVSLSIVALTWGLVNFGLLLWLPADLAARGYSMGALSRLLAFSALIAAPTVFLCAFIYSRWSTKWSLIAMIGTMALGLALVLRMLTASGPTISPILPVALLIVGSNGVLAILLPYTAESYPLRVRGRATGWVAGCSKFGGLLAQLLSMLVVVPAVGVAAGLIMIPTLLAMGLVARFGTETRGRDLRELEAPPPAGLAVAAGG